MGLLGRPREVTLYDSALSDDPPRTLEDLAPAATGAPDPASGRRHSRRAAIAAVLAPAVIAGLAGVLLTPAGDNGPGAAFAPSSASAAQLARLADDFDGPKGLDPLVPIVERQGRAQLGTYANPVADTRPAAPRRIAIPDARVSAPVDSVGANSSGLELPVGGRAGWWKGGPRPGEAGRSVIVGHLDSKKGPDVFAHVPYLKRGAPIAVQDAAGVQHLYTVVGVTRVQKAQFPTEQVYGRARHPVLVLVTCGGPYDKALGHYRDNVLVYARAV